MLKGGFVSKEALDKMESQFNEKPSWWLLDGELVHCCSWELKTIKEIRNKNK